MKLIQRHRYLNDLISVRNTPDIKVITGIRRSGKSKLLEAFAEWVKENEPSAHLLQIDFNLPQWKKLLSDGNALYEYVISNTPENVTNYVLIDEVQNCKSFEWAVNGLHALERYRKYFWPEHDIPKPTTRAFA